MALETGGQIDWVALVDKAVSLPVGMLSRYSQSGIQPYTLEFCQAMGQLFRRVNISRQDQFEIQLNQAKAVGFSSKFLYIGTGISAIPRQLAATKGGISFAIVAYALRTCFSPEYTSRVLNEITKLAVPEDTHTPPSGQYQLLCEEVMAATKDPGFLNMLETICSMLSPSDERHDVPAADDLASSILALFTMPEDESIVVKGPANLIGWLVVFSHWYLGHKVTLFIDGHMLWDNESVFLTRGFDSVGAGDSKGRVRPKGEVIFKCTSDYREKVDMDATVNELQVMKEANINIILERPDTVEHNWTNLLPLDELIAYSLRDYLVDQDEAQAIRTLFFERFLCLLNCWIVRDTVGSVNLGVTVGDMARGRVHDILKFLCRKLESFSLLPSSEEQRRLDQVLAGEIQVFDTNTSTPPLHTIRSRNRAAGLLLDAIVVMIFLDTTDYSLLLVKKSWSGCNPWSTSNEVEEKWVYQHCLHYGDIVQLFYRMADYKTGRFKPDSKLKRRLGMTTQGFYLFSPVLMTNTDFYLPPQELLRYNIGRGGIYINGHLATTVESSGDDAQTVTPAPQHGVDMTEDCVFRDILREDSLSKDFAARGGAVSINPEAVSRNHNLTANIKSYVEQISGTSFAVVWTITVRSGYKIFLDEAYSPLRLITPYCRENKQVIDPQWISALERPLTACFFNIQQLHYLKPFSFQRTVDCFILCCDRETTTSVLIHTYLNLAELVYKDEEESIADFCRRLAYLNTCSSRSQDLEAYRGGANFRLVGIIFD